MGCLLKKGELLEAHLCNTDGILLVIIITGSENLRQSGFAIQMRKFDFSPSLSFRVLLKLRVNVLSDPRS